MAIKESLNTSPAGQDLLSTPSAGQDPGCLSDQDKGGR